MPTLSERADFAEDSDAKRAVKAAMVLAAVQVSSESPEADNHQHRSALARTVLVRPDAWVESFVWAMSTNPTVVDKWVAGDQQGAKADFEFVMGTLWDAIAGRAHLIPAVPED